VYLPGITPEKLEIYLVVGIAETRTSMSEERGDCAGLPGSAHHNLITTISEIALLLKLRPRIPLSTDLLSFQKQRHTRSVKVNISRSVAGLQPLRVHDVISPVVPLAVEPLPKIRIEGRVRRPSRIARRIRKRIRLG